MLFCYHGLAMGSYCLQVGNSIKKAVRFYGSTIFCFSGDKWRKDRKLLTPAFHFQILDGFFDVFNRNSEIFVEQIKKRLLVEKEIDIYPMTSRCTLDIICGMIVWNELLNWMLYKISRSSFIMATRGCNGNPD